MRTEEEEKHKGGCPDIDLKRKHPASAGPGNSRGIICHRDKICIESDGYHATSSVGNGYSNSPYAIIPARHITRLRLYCRPSSCWNIPSIRADRTSTNPPRLFFTQKSDDICNISWITYTVTRSCSGIDNLFYLLVSRRFVPPSCNIWLVDAKSFRIADTGKLGWRAIKNLTYPF